MAEETMTGAKTEVVLDPVKAAADKEKMKKLIIKVVVIAVVIVAAIWLYKKFVK
jgi:flagellar biogenesis protein FliO